MKSRDAVEEDVQVAVRTPDPAPGLRGASSADRILGLQRTAGNRAVGRLLARDELDPFAPAPAMQRERVEVTELKYACIFVGHDLYGTQARRFVKFAFKDHLMIEASSLEDAMAKIEKDLENARKGGKTAHIAEVTLIAHGNPSGFIAMPLVAGAKGTTVEEIDTLHKTFETGGKPQFKESRVTVLSAIDHRTDVIVRGCRAGRSKPLVDALTAFWGGQATVYVPTEYQAFTRLRIGGKVIPTPEAAYDFAVAKGYVPYGIADTPRQKQAWVRANLPDGYLPEMWFVDEADGNAEKVRHAGADDPAIQGLKNYDAAQMIGLDKWAEGRSDLQRNDDAHFNASTTEDVVKEAKGFLAELRDLERTAPDDWMAIGEKAWWLMRCDAEWRRRPEAAADPSSDDPLIHQGLYPSISGLVYDTNIVAGQAGKRPDLTIEHNDAFTKFQAPSVETPVSEVSEEQIDGRAATPPPPSADPKSIPFVLPPTDTPSTANGAIVMPPAVITASKPAVDLDQLRSKGQGVIDAIKAEQNQQHPDEQKIAQLAEDMLKLDRQWQNSDAARTYTLEDKSGDPLAGIWIPGLSYDTNLLAMQAARRKRAQGKPASKKDGTLVLPPDEIRSDPGAIDYPHASLDLDPGAAHSKSTAPIGGGGRPANIKKKFPIKFTAGSPDGYFQVKGAEIGLEGYAEWGVKGERELAVGNLFSFEKGKPMGVGLKEEAKLQEWKWDSGFYMKWKGGLETAQLWGEGDEKGKWEVSTAIEWGYEGYVGELKVFCSYDTVKNELRIGGVKVTPVGIQGEFPIPTGDGTQVKFKGKVVFTVDIQPNWALIAEKLGLRVGTVAAETAVTGGGIGTGLAAIGTAEAATLGLAAAGVAITLYAYYRGVKDWQDIKAILPVARQASDDICAGFVSTFGVSTDGDHNGPGFAKGAAIGKQMSRTMAARMVKGWESRNPGKKAPFTLDDAEKYSNEQIALHPESRNALRYYAYGAFHKWVMAEFYRHWVHEHTGEWTEEKNEKYARTYLGLPLDGDPPNNPAWDYRPRAEPRVIEDWPY